MSDAQVEAGGLGDEWIDELAARAASQVVKREILTGVTLTPKEREDAQVYLAFLMVFSDRGDPSAAEAEETATEMLLTVKEGDGHQALLERLQDFGGSPETLESEKAASKRVLCTRVVSALPLPEGVH